MIPLLNYLRKNRKKSRGVLVTEQQYESCCIVITNYTHIQAGNIVNTIMTNGHSSLEKYTSHTLFERVAKGLRKVYVWEVSWRLNKAATYWPPALLAIAVLLSHPAGLLNRGPWGPSSLLGLVLAASNCNNWPPNSDLQLTWTSCGTGLYNCLSSTCFSERRFCTQFNPSTVKGIPWYLQPDAPVIYTGAFLIWQLGRVGGQYVTFFWWL